MATDKTKSLKKTPKAPARKKPGGTNVKKATAKKSPSRKRIEVKKKENRTAAVKKPAVKKPAVKKTAVKKPVPQKKTLAKKPAVKKSAPKKSVARKKAPLKKTSIKSPIAKTVAVHSQVAVSNSSVALLERPLPTIKSTPVVEVKPVITSQTEKKKKSTIGYFLAFGAIVLIATAIATNSDSSTESAEPTPQATASQTASENPSPTVELGAPIDVYADYTPTGGKITWKAPSPTDQLTSYLVQTSYRGGAYKTIATLDPAVLSHEVTKIDTPGFTTFRVVAVYGDQEVASAISELKGQYEG